MSSFFRRWRAKGPYDLPTKLDVEVREEIRFYLEMRTLELIQQGLSPGKAREAALKAFGDPNLVAAECVERLTRDRPSQRVREMMSRISQDIRYGLRVLGKNRVFTGVAVLTLGLGIGANTAIFSVVNGVLLSPLPYEGADQLVVVREHNLEMTSPTRWAAPLNFRDWREQNQTFESLTAWRWNPFTLTGDGSPERLVGYVVSAGFFRQLRITMTLGRGFLSEEDQPRRERVAVISEALWQRRYGGDQEIVGRAITLSGEPHVVVGVAPSVIGYPGDGEVWTPIAFEYEREHRSFRYAGVLGRIKPGVTLSAARADLDRIAARLASDHPDTNRGWGVLVEPLRDRIVGNSRPALLMLLVAVAFVLLIAIANVANLLLARVTARQKEVVIRQALGAGRGRLARQFLTESLLLALAGGTLGFLLSLWGTKSLMALSAGQIPRADSVTLDWRVLGFTLLTSIIAGVAFGLVPALKACGLNLSESLKESGASSSWSPRGVRFREALVVAEVALALVLQVGATLLAASFANLVRIDPGFVGVNTLAMELNLSEGKYQGDAQQVAVYEEILQGVKALPGVASAGTIHPMPLATGSVSTALAIEGQAASSREDRPEAHSRITGPGYFETLGIPLVQGRYLSDTDTDGALPVAVINRTLADRFFLNEEAIGRRITFYDPSAPDAVWLTIVGVVGDVRFRDLRREAEPEVYVSVFQEPFRYAYLVVRAHTDPAILAGAVRNAVRAVDADLPIFNVQEVDEIVAGTLGRPRFSLTVLTLFAAGALVLAAIGVFGVLSVWLGGQIRELGIRLALGAPRWKVVRRVVGRGMRPVALWIR
jgi:predicted permease